MKKINRESRPIYVYNERGNASSGLTVMRVLKTVDFTLKCKIDARQHLCAQQCCLQVIYAH